MEEQHKLERLLSALPWVVGGAALILLIAYIWVFRELPANESPPAWGAFGDYVGGLLNPLVSTFTLIVAVKVWRQQKIEMAETKKALEEQVRTAEQQRQEQRFFDLLNTYYRTVEGLRIDKRSMQVLRSAVQVDSFFGKEAIREWLSSYVRFGEFLQDKGQYVVSGNPAAGVANQALLTEFGLEWGGSSEVSDRFGPYLRTVDKLLATADLVLTIHKLEYLLLFRAQLSNSELALIGYQLLLGQESSEFQKNAERFGLLATLSNGDLRSAPSDRLSASAFAYSNETLQGATPC
jgi:Putative phage abortive infection protein